MGATQTLELEVLQKLKIFYDSPLKSVDQIQDLISIIGSSSCFLTYYKLVWFFHVKWLLYLFLTKQYPSFRGLKAWPQVSVLLYQYFLPTDCIFVHGFKYYLHVSDLQVKTSALMYSLSSRFVYSTVNIISHLNVQQPSQI